MHPWRARILAAICMAWFGVALLYPLAHILRGGFMEEGRFTTRFLLGVFRNPVYAAGLANSLIIAACATLLAGAIAVPLAILHGRFQFPGRGLLTGLILAPMVLPPFVGAIGLQQILGQYGALNALLGLGPVDWLGSGGGGRYVGVVILQALSLYPIIFLNVSAALGRIDATMDQAARNLGASAWMRLRRITLPLCLPGLYAGGTLVFIGAFTDLGTPLMLGCYRCAPVQVFDALKEIGGGGLPYALVVVMLATGVGLYALCRLALGRRAGLVSGPATAPAGAPATGGWLIALPFVGVATLALLPHLGVVLVSLAPAGTWYRTALPAEWSLENYRQALGHSMVVGSIRISVVLSALAVALNAALAVTVALVAVRSRLRWRGMVDMLAMLPLAVPGLVMAFGYLGVSQNLTRLSAVKDTPWLRGMLDVQTNPMFLLVIAFAVRRLPYMVRAAAAGLEMTPPVLEDAGRNLGASGARTLRRITLPLMASSLLAGGILAFAFSMLEVSDSLILAQRAEYLPITKTIYELSQLIGTGRQLAAALGTWSMAFLASALLAAGVLLGRRLGMALRV